MLRWICQRETPQNEPLVGKASGWRDADDGKRRQIQSALISLAEDSRGPVSGRPTRSQFHNSGKRLITNLLEWAEGGGGLLFRDPSHFHCLLKVISVLFK